MFLPPPLPPLTDEERRRVREALYWLELALAGLFLLALAVLASGHALGLFGGWSLTASACLAVPVAVLLGQAALLAPASWNWLE